MRETKVKVKICWVWVYLCIIISSVSHTLIYLYTHTHKHEFSTIFSNFQTLLVTFFHKRYILTNVETFVRQTLAIIELEDFAFSWVLVYDSSESRTDPKCQNLSLTQTWHNYVINKQMNMWRHLPPKVSQNPVGNTAFYILYWLQAQSCSPCGLVNQRQMSEMCLIRWTNCYQRQ